MNRLSVLVVVLVFGNGHAMATTDVLVTAPAGGSPNEAWPRTMSLGTVAAETHQAGGGVHRPGSVSGMSIAFRQASR